MKKVILISTAALGMALLSAQASAITSFTYTYNTGIDNQSDGGSLLNDNELGTSNWNGGDYVGFGDAGATAAWASATFTLDAVYDLATIDLYTFNIYNAGEVTVSTSTDNVTFSTPTQYILANTPVGGTSTAVTDSLDVSALADAQYVKIDWFKTVANSGTGNWVFISEVDFDGAAVPEPSSFALIAGMFGLTWVMLRRRA